MATRLRFVLLAALVLGIGACGDSSPPTADTTVDGGNIDTTSDATSDGTPGGDITVDGPAGDTTNDGPAGDTTSDAPSDSTSDTVSPDTTADLPPPDTSVDTASADAFVTPTNATCANAKVVALANGRATVIGSTTGLSAEYTLSCDRNGTTSATTLSGGSAYYKFTPVQNNWYRVRITPRFDNAVVALFTNPSCAEADIETDCQSQGGTGNTSLIIDQGETGTVYYRAGAPTDIFIVVQGDNSSDAGDFQLDIEEFTPPTNGTCAAAQTLTLTNGVGTVKGDIAPLLTPDEFATLSCRLFGSSSVSTTNYDGPQAYYKFAATQGRVYRVTVKGSHTRYVYLFRSNTCTQASIETDCQSTGNVDGGYDSESTNDVVINWVAPATGDVYVGIDSTIGTEWGEVELTVEDTGPPPSNTKCANAQTVTLTNGSATITDATDALLTPDEFSQLNCKYAGATSTSSTDLDGPQLYYKFAATQDQWYRIALSPGFTSYFYVFTNSACTEASIGADCQSDGATGGAQGSISSGKTEQILFKAPATGDVYVAVDSSSNTSSGAFQLDIEAVTAPTNGTCANAQALTFTAGKAEVTGVTDPYATPDEFGGAKCGSTSLLDGPQAYYSFTAQANTTYKVTLESVATSGSMYAYVFGSTCAKSNIDADCSSDSTGTVTASVSSTAGSKQSVYVTPGAGTYNIGVDSTIGTVSGRFKLTVEEIAAATPANGVCSGATAITLTAGKGSVTGSTVAVANEYGTTVQCGGNDGFDGGQVYYTVQTVAGGQYTFNLTADFDAQLYAFTGACSASNINTACASGGVSGDVSSNGTSLVFNATQAGTVTIVVDGANPSNQGTFTLDVSEFIVPTLTAPLSLDFETASGGLAATRDWQWGSTLNFQATSACFSATSYTAPTNNQGPTGGTGMWGTVLNDCYGNLDNNEGTCSSSGSTDTSNDSRLVFRLTIPGSWTTATMQWAQWFDVNGSFDFGDIHINGTSVRTYCSKDASWKTESLDLSSYAGQTIEVSFNMVASSVVAYAGWYIDSLQVTGN